MYIKRLIFPSLILLVLLQSSCGTAKYLENEEYLLKKNEVILETVEKIPNKPSLRYELSTLIDQKTNNKFFFAFPREWFYLKNEHKEERTRVGKWVDRFIAQAPTIFNDTLSQRSSNKMQRYLIDKGYFDAEVEYEDVQRGKSRVGVKYYVKPGKQLFIDSVIFESEDKELDSILQHIKDRSLFAEREPLTLKSLEVEKSRIVDYLRNHGYWKFSKIYFPRSLDVDIYNNPNDENYLYITVNPPGPDTTHNVYTIGDITIYPDFQIDYLLNDSLVALLKDTLINDTIIFRSLDFDFPIKPQIILDLIQLKKGSLYRQADFELTDQGLRKLQFYENVRIKVIPDTTNLTQLNFFIELTPDALNVFSFDVELDYTNRSANAGAGNLIGVNASPTLYNRNFLKGGEIFSSDLSAGVEFNPTPGERFWNTIDFGANFDVYLPRFRDYFGFWKLFSRLKKSPDLEEDSETFVQKLKSKAETRIRTSYNYIQLLNFYQYNLLTASYGYDFAADEIHRYTINNLAIDYFNPIIGNNFKPFLEVNPFLDRSFRDQLFVSLLLREFNYTYVGPTNRFGDSRFLRINFETAGGEIWAANAIYNGFSSAADTLSIGDTDFSQYFRVEMENHFRRFFTEDNVLAARLAFGLALPFGFSSDVPYVKQFYVGGPNSIRAWPARGLGPGGYIDSLTLATNNPLLFYQTGDLKLEFNLEYRFNIFWLMNGAIFLDVGNIWTLREDTSRPESQFLFRAKKDGERIIADPFYKQFAIGTGFGLRFDLQFFIFRLDLGLPIKYPYRWREGRYWVYPQEWSSDNINFNFSLGFPF